MTVFKLRERMPKTLAAKLLCVVCLPLLSATLENLARPPIGIYPLSLVALVPMIVADVLVSPSDEANDNPPGLDVRPSRVARALHSSARAVSGLCFFFFNAVWVGLSAQPIQSKPLTVPVV